MTTGVVTLSTAGRLGKTFAQRLSVRREVAAEAAAVVEAKLICASTTTEPAETFALMLTASGYFAWRPLMKKPWLKVATVPAKVNVEETVVRMNPPGSAGGGALGAMAAMAAARVVASGVAVFA